MRIPTALRRHLSSETGHLRATIFSWGPGSRSACILGKQTHNVELDANLTCAQRNLLYHNNIRTTSCQINIERCNLNRVSLKFFSRISPILKRKEVKETWWHKTWSPKIGHSFLTTRKPTKALSPGGCKRGACFEQGPKVWNRCPCAVAGDL